MHAHTHDIRSEFAHPDIVISLTILGYRYEGLRRSDFLAVMKALQAAMWEETGPYEQRPSAKTFAFWVKKAGGRVKGTLSKAKMLAKKKADIVEEKSDAVEVMPPKALALLARNHDGY